MRAISNWLRVIVGAELAAEQRLLALHRGRGIADAHRLDGPPATFQGQQMTNEKARVVIRWGPRRRPTKSFVIAICQSADDSQVVGS